VVRLGLVAPSGALQPAWRHPAVGVGSHTTHRRILRCRLHDIDSFVARLSTRRVRWYAAPSEGWHDGVLHERDAEQQRHRNCCRRRSARFPLNSAFTTGHNAHSLSLRPERTGYLVPALLKGGGGARVAGADLIRLRPFRSDRTRVNAVISVPGGVNIALLADATRANYPALQLKPSEENRVLCLHRLGRPPSFRFSSDSRTGQAFFRRNAILSAKASRSSGRTTSSLAIRIQSGLREYDHGNGDRGGHPPFPYG